jgi:hypothetical protein
MTSSAAQLQDRTEGCHATRTAWRSGGDASLERRRRIASLAALGLAGFAIS